MPGTSKKLSKHIFIESQTRYSDRDDKCVDKREVCLLKHFHHQQKTDCNEARAGKIVRSFH